MFDVRQRDKHIYTNSRNRDRGQEEGLNSKHCYKSTSTAGRTQVVHAQPPTNATQATLFLWMVGAKLRPITVRRRLPGFEGLIFRSVILAAACLAAPRDLNRIHFLVKRNMAGVSTHHSYPVPGSQDRVPVRGEVFYVFTAVVPPASA